VRNKTSPTWHLKSVDGEAAARLGGGPPKAGEVG
jgi:hypothetical protein